MEEQSREEYIGSLRRYTNNSNFWQVVLPVIRSDGVAKCDDTKDLSSSYGFAPRLFTQEKHWFLKRGVQVQRRRKAGLILQDLYILHIFQSLARKTLRVCMSVKFRDVFCRHHHNGKWEARIGRVFGNKYLYLGTYATQEEAAMAYDLAVIEHRGLNAVTNFDVSRYIKWHHHRHNHANDTDQLPVRTSQPPTIDLNVTALRDNDRLQQPQADRAQSAHSRPTGGPSVCCWPIGLSATRFKPSRPAVGRQGPVGLQYTDRPVVGRLCSVGLLWADWCMPIFNNIL
uniref:AP2-like ethylene-responsive transcription factor n=1 Tax=Aegilops tauschii TaxID=37682 RepID=M8AWI8_AEGTA